MTPVTDERLKEKIKDKLYEHPEINSDNVELFVKDGYVSINGIIDSPDAKSTIEAIVANIEGVIDVGNFLQLRAPFESGSGNGIHHME